MPIGSEVPICGDGIVIRPQEECDDGDSRENDGCTNCIVDFMFECINDIDGPSVCDAILIDLNVPDNTTLGYSDEFFDLNRVFFLSDPNGTNMTSFITTSLGGVPRVSGYTFSELTIQLEKNVDSS